MEVRFTVSGKPVPKGRPRVTRFHTYTPQTTVDYENRVREAWHATGAEPFPEKTPLFVDVRAHMEIPRSYSKKRRAEMVGTWHTNHGGDIDNIAKAVLDALNGHAFDDDCAVVMIRASKDYAAEPSTEVIIRDWSEFFESYEKV